LSYSPSLSYCNFCAPAAKAWQAELLYQLLMSCR